MSGIEIAGLVLGTIPLLLPALDIYKDGLSRMSVFVRRRRHVEELIRALGVNRLLLDQNVRLLLTKVGVEEIPTNSLDLFRRLAEDKDINEDVKVFLGPEAYKLYVDTVAACEIVIRDLVKSIEGFLPKQAGLQNDLISLLEANANITHGRLDLKQRFKLTLDRTRLDDIIKQLDGTIQVLDRLQSAIDATRQATKGSHARRSSRMAASIEATRRQVLKLCSSIDKAMTKCQARNHDHPAQLYLDSCTQSIASQGLLKTRTLKPQQCFQLRIACTSNDPSLVWHETKIEFTSEDPPATMTASGGAQKVVRVRFPTVVHPQSAGTSLEDIDNLCHKLQSLGTVHSPLQLCIYGAGNIAGRQQAMDRADLITALTTVTLEQALSRTSVTSAVTTPAMGLRARMILALNLAIALLHVYQTPWLGQNWSKTGVAFLQVSSAPGSMKMPNARIRFDQPLLSHKFGPAVQSSSSNSLRPQQAILQLAIMLLELWHDETIEAYAQTSVPHDHWARMQMASAWISDTSNEPLPLYGDAVRHCLKLSIFDSSWDDADFRRDYCENVIEPLRQSCEDWLRKTP